MKPLHDETTQTAKRPFYKMKRVYILSVVIIALASATVILAVTQSGKRYGLANTTSIAPARETQQLPAFINTVASYDAPTSNVKFVSPSGNDSANGNTVDTPYKSICKALASSATDGTIVLRGGVYREGSGGDGGCNAYKASKKVHLQSYQAERAWVKGSLIATNWQADGSGRWKTSWSYLNGLESKIPDSNKDALGPSNPLGGDAAQVFINGTSLKQVGSLGEVKAGTFYVDRGAKTIHIGSDPSANTVEITAFPRFIYFLAGAAGSSVKGVGFAQFGSSWNQSTNPGALLLQADSITLDNTVFTQNAAWGLAMISTRQTLRNSVLSYNGHNGVLGNRMDGSVIENSIFDHNNTESLGTETCGISCTAAGVKLAHADGLTVRNNTFSNNKGYGFWCDLTCQNLTFVNNTSHDNSKSGIFYEVSSVAIIASNLIYNNKVSGIRIAGSDRVRIYNNTLVNNGTGKDGLEGSIGIYDDTRAPEPYGVQRGVTWNTSEVEIVNNIMAYNNQSPFLDIRKSTQVAAESMVSKLSSNAYYRKTTQQPTVVVHRYGNSDVRATTLATAINAGIEKTSSIANDNDGKLFSGSSYTVDPASAIYHKAEAIPSDILQAIGNPAGPYSIGYLGASQLSVPGTPTTAPVVDLDNPTIPNPSTGTNATTGTNSTNNSSSNQNPNTATSTTRDTTPPNVKITAPKNDEKVSGIYTLRADASDNSKIAKVEFYVNGYFIGADSDAPYAVNWNSSLAKDGTYPVAAIAYDTTGNRTASSNVTVVSKNAIPISVSLKSPTNNQTIGKNTKFRLEATVSASIPVAKVEFYVNNYLIGADTASDYWVYWNNTTVANGKYPVVAKVHTQDGRVVTSDTVSINLKK
ncbi:MAG: Ig-like domain-containing protein [Candidatus Saccharimonas sp.]